MFHELRIELNDSTQAMISKMCKYSDGPEGYNPGALNVLLSMIDHGQQIDPDDAFAPFGAIMSLDTYGIYADRIWMLFKDVCKENIIDTLGMLRACQLGIINIKTLNHAIDNRGEGLDVQAAMIKVRKELPGFTKETTM